MAADAAHVDLIAREEEQQAEAEVGEEGDELVDVQAEHVRPDHDAEQQLDDDHRHDHPGGR